MHKEHHHRPLEWIDFGWSLAVHAALLVLAAFLIVRAPEVGVEVANIAAEFQLFEAPASEPAPERMADKEPPPPSDPPPIEESDPLKPKSVESLPIEMPQSPVAAIRRSAKPGVSSVPKHSDNSRNPKPRSRASAPVNGAREVLPDYLRNPPPAYPEPSRLAHEEGVVMLVVDVGHAGNPTEVRLQQSSGYSALDQAAIRAVRNWKFRPGTMAGMAVASSVSIPVRFELH